ncbi:MAG: cytochrome P450 [Acidimicrobiaceae bacterium]|nr:cytochrome P450 [Acidimicrobiaceae bacterium]
MGLGDSISLADLEREPAPILARLRTQEPVCWIPAMDMWLVTRWDDVAFMEEHPELFTAATEPSFLARTLGSNMLTCDPPVHSRLQEIMQPPFQPGGRSGEFVSNELTGIADRLLDAVDPAGFDVMADYAQPLSAGTLATVLGLDSYGFDRMWDWCEGLCTDLANFEDDPDLAAIGKRTKADLGAVLAKRIAEAGNNGSAISWFVQNGATPEEIVNNVRLMISGGINEPRDGIGLVAWLLLSEPSLASAVDAEPTKMRRLIEEMFRVHSPVGTVTRQATQDLELAGVAIAKGDLVSGVLRSINLDESHWTNPDVIDLTRREGSHAAFALGAHRCLGEWLGRQEIRVGVERLFARFPNLRLDPSHEVELHGFEFRGPRSVHVLTSVSP